MKIQGHRGASNERPENSMSSFKRAIELGADAIELDVYKLSDGIVVVHHDEYLGRCEDASGYICDYDRQSIKSFTIGKNGPEEYADSTVPYFYEVLELLSDVDIGLNVEIKYQGLNGIENDVVALLEKYRMCERSIISSFTKSYLHQIKEKYPQYKVGVLYSSPFEPDMVAYCKKYKFDALHPKLSLVDKSFVQNSHKNGLQVNTWTVDKEKDIRKMLELGVDSIITNDIVTAKKVLEA